MTFNVFKNFGSTLRSKHKGARWGQKESEAPKRAQGRQKNPKQSYFQNLKILAVRSGPSIESLLPVDPFEIT